MIAAIVALAVTLSDPPTITPAPTPAPAQAGTTTDPKDVQVQARPTKPTKTAKSDANDPDRVICRTQPVTGSRFTQRICMTKAQMDERDRQTQLYEQQQQNLSGLASHSTSAFSGQ